MMRAALLLVCLVGAASGLQVGSQFTGQYNDPETSAEHPLFRIHANGTLINLPSYEPAGIEPNLDTTGPVSGMLVHHIDAAGRPDLACDSAAGKNYSGKIVLVKRGVCHFVLKIRNIQAAHATAVVVYDNKREGWIRMAWDHTVQPEIPAIFIQKNEADHLLYYMDSAAGTTGLEATLLPDNENSLRLTIDSLTEQLPGLMNVEGTVESRRTVEGHMGTDYMKYKVSGSINTDTGVVSLSPKEWITTAKDDEQGWFGLEGNLLTPAKTMSGKTTPFKSHFHMREIEPNPFPLWVICTPGSKSCCKSLRSF